MKYKLNWKPDLPDFRDIMYKAVHKYSLTALPASADLRSKCSPVENQDQLGSCTSFSLAGAMEFLEEKSLISNTVSAEILIPKIYTPFSHLFIYYNERIIGNDVMEDGGGQLRDGIKTLATLGGCSELTWPYDESKVFDRPSDSSYLEASKHKITSYTRLNSISDMKHCLADGYPFAFGFTVYDSFESETTAKTGIVTMPSYNDSCIGGHAVLAVGYDDIEQMFIVRNSWGPTWGLQGYFKLPYQYIANPNLASDFWTIRR